jgi:hypothetical protein
MEREGAAEAYRLMRAVRSLAYNRKLKPVIEGRIERAEAKVRGYMMVNGLSSSRIGAFEVELDEDGDLSLTRLQSDDWQQLSLPRVDDTGNGDESVGLEERTEHKGLRIAFAADSQ